MSIAMSAVQNGDMGLRDASRTYNVPLTTLKRRLDGKNKYAVGCSKHLGRPTMLPRELETELVQHVLLCEAMLFGFTRKSLMKLAFELAEKNGLSHVFNRDKQEAGKDWLALFLKRHPSISLRSPEATSMARATGFNRRSVERFYDILIDVIDKHGLTSTNIYNMDESGISTVQKKCQKVLGKKGKHQIGAISSGERGTNTTVVCCSSAAGQFVPPFMIFKRKRMSPELANGAPSGSYVTNNDSGWMDSEMFLNWLDHFIKCVRPNKENKVLLLLDGASSHTTSLAAVNMARENGIIIMSFPPHTTHKLQPLDVSFFKPLQTYYGQAQETWLRSNPGRTITPFQICHLFNIAYMKAASVGTINNGFKKCGIWPCNRHVFSESDFVFNTPSLHEQSHSTACTTPISPATVDPSASAVCVAVDKAQSAVREAVDPPPSAARKAVDPPPSAARKAVDPPPYVACESVDPPPSAVREAVDQPPSAVREAVDPPLSVACESVDPPPSAVREAVDPPPSPAGSFSPRNSVFNKKIIPTNPDGRCFFRSVVIDQHMDLQNAERNENGNPSDPLLKLQEQVKADSLRAQTVQHMLNNITDFSNEEVILNADMPSTRYKSIADRISDMTLVNTCVGEMEIRAACDVVKKTINIHHKEGGNVITYRPKCENFLGHEINILYSPFGNNSGHYECLVHLHVRVSDLSPLPIRQTEGKKRKYTKSESEILTSSPYKKRLVERLEKKTKTKRGLAKSKTVTVKGKQGSKQSKDKHAHRQKSKLKSCVESDSWYCFMCGECTEESMIKCTKCMRWVHEECAGTSGCEPDSYRCEMCIA